MKDKNQAIEQFLLDNLEDFKDISNSAIGCQFYNHKLKIYLIPNIEEFEIIIPSNYDSTVIRVNDIVNKNNFNIKSKKIADELKKKASLKIQEALENRKVASMAEEEKEEYMKERFLNNFIK